MTLEELREALEKATGPDQKIDYELTDVFNRGAMPPPYTASIDAASSLIPRRAWKEISGPRRYINIPSPSPNYWRCSIATFDPWEETVGWGATEALAICVAVVRRMAICPERKK